MRRAATALLASMACIQSALAGRSVQLRALRQQDLQCTISDPTTNPFFQPAYSSTECAKVDPSNPTDQQCAPCLCSLTYGFGEAWNADAVQSDPRFQGQDPAAFVQLVRQLLQTCIVDYNKLFPNAGQAEMGMMSCTNDIQRTIRTLSNSASCQSYLQLFTPTPGFSPAPGFSPEPSTDVGSSPEPSTNVVFSPEPSTDSPEPSSGIEFSPDFQPESSDFGGFSPDVGSSPDLGASPAVGGSPAPVFSPQPGGGSSPSSSPSSTIGSPRPSGGSPGTFNPPPPGGSLGQGGNSTRNGTRNSAATSVMSSSQLVLGALGALCLLAML